MRLGRTETGPGPAGGADIVLEGKRVRLCPAREQDWSHWARVRGLNAARLKPLEPTWSDDALTQGFFRRRVEALRREWQAGSCASFLIWQKSGWATPQLVGGFNLNHICRGAAQHATLGYWIAAEAEGQGLMTEAAALACDFAFGSSGLHRLQAGTLVHNMRSQALLRRLGFQEEGFAKAYVKIDGRWQDHVLFGLVADDWRATRR